MSSSRRLSSLNELSFGEPVWLASDIHLGAHNPRTSAAFYEFLALASEKANALILLGDIFDVWIGDDWANHPAPWLQTALLNLQQTAKAIPLWLMGGNRDFLIGDSLTRQLGAHHLGSQCILQILPTDRPCGAATERYLLVHGDEFCTADRSYQRFRAIVRNPMVQAAFLRLPLRLRRSIARRARQTSMQNQKSPDFSWLDVQDTALSARLDKLGIAACIHGHTHRPGHYQVQSVSAPDKLSRWVLPDWECDHLEMGESPRGGWIQVDSAGAALFDLNGQKMK